MDKHKTTIETYNLTAEAFAEKFMDFNLYNESYNILCGYLKPNAKILELGCGPGNLTKYLLEKRPDLKITGIDLAPKMVELAKSTCPNAHFQVMDFRDIGELDEQFDAVIVAFCMPYLTKEECAKLIADASSLLPLRGILYLSTMEDDSSRSGFETTSFSGTNQVYVYYHQYGDLAGELLLNGFDIMETMRQDYPEDDGSTTTDLILIAKKERELVD